MNIINRHTNELIIPRINRCGDSDCRIFQLVLQKRSTNKLFVFKLRDYAFKDSIRHHFKFAVPDEMDLGEYNLFLVSSGEWQQAELNDLFIKDTFRQTDKGAITINGQYIVSNGRILVTKNKKSELKKLNDFTGRTGIYYTFTEQSKDPRVEGELFEEIDIIYSGLLKLVPDELTSIDNYVERVNTKNNKFVEYGG